MNKVVLTQEILNDLVIGDILSDKHKHPFDKDRTIGNNYEIIENIGNKLIIRCIYGDKDFGEPCELRKDWILKDGRYYQAI